MTSTLLNGLSVYWRLDDLSDATNSTVNLTNNGSVPFVTGIVRYGVQTGTGQYLSLTSVPSVLVGGTSFTISCWVKASSYSGGRGIVGKFASNNGYLISCAINRLFFQIGTVTTVVGGIATNVWHLLTMAYDLGALQASIQVDNGTPLILNQPTPPADDAVEFRIGSRADTGVNFIGSIDEVGLWKRVLTASEIAELYNGGAGNTYPFEYSRGRASIGDRPIDLVSSGQSRYHRISSNDQRKTLVQPGTVVEHVVSAYDHRGGVS